MVHGPYREGDRWRVVTKNDDGTRSSKYFSTEEAAVDAMRDTEQRVASGQGVASLAAALMSQAVPCPADPAWIYFLKDEAGDIVYVGVTGQIGSRLLNHVETGKVFSAASIIPSVFERSAALEVERMLVRTLRPRLNSHHNSAYGTRSTRSSSGDDPAE
jgi:predicted GIY-YIG superfamily endonuclease